MKKTWLNRILLTFLFTLASIALIIPAQGCAQSDSQAPGISSGTPAGTLEGKPETTPVNSTSQAADIAAAALYQPEIKITAPAEVLNGQAFVLKVNSSRLERIKCSWAGKQLSVDALPASGGGFEAVALLGVDLDSKAEMRKLDLSIVDNGKEIMETLDILVSKKKYPQQELKVEPRFVQLSEADLKRSQEERAITNAVLAAHTPERQWSLPFVRPVPGTVSSLFGVARVFNGEPRSAHKGLDLRGAAGTPIVACADGTVALAGDLFFSGNAVYLDHGLGVFTIYCHMSEIKVREGDLVKAGDLLGLVGSTGRVTGPHLHLSACVMGVSVDPAVLLEMNMDGDMPGANAAAVLN